MAIFFWRITFILAIYVEGHLRIIPMKFQLLFKANCWQPQTTNIIWSQKLMAQGKYKTIYKRSSIFFFKLSCINELNLFDEDNRTYFHPTGQLQTQWIVNVCDAVHKKNRMECVQNEISDQPVSGGVMVDRLTSMGESSKFPKS